MGKAAFRAALLVLCALWCAPAASAQTSALPRPRSSVLIVLDGSSAMRGAKLRAAKAAASAAVQAVPAGTPIRVRRYRANKGTAPCSPANLAEPPPGVSTIVLVEAAATGCSAQSVCLVATPRSGARLDVIGLEVSAADRRALQCAATAARGIYPDARTPGALRPELVAAVLRATRDRRPLGRQLAGGLEQQQATPAQPGEYVDSIAPDSDLFSFQSDGTVTVQTATPLAPGSYSVKVALHDSADKHLAARLHGRSLPLELAFDALPARPRNPPKAHPTAIRKGLKHDVSWGAALGTFAGAALLAFLIAARGRWKGGEGGQ